MLTKHEIEQVAREPLTAAVAEILRLTYGDEVPLLGRARSTHEDIVRELVDRLYQYGLPTLQEARDEAAEQMWEPAP